MTAPVFDRIHASCVAIEGRGVLLTGASGVGKSDVALRLIDSGAELVSDDQTELRLVGAEILASPPTTLEGLLEIRMVGLLRLPFRPSAALALAVELVGVEEKCERLPEASFASLLGKSVRRLKLYGLAASTPAIIRAALREKIEDV